MTAALTTTPPKCGADKRGGGTCGQAAGWGTSHAGVGRCKLHGGSTPNHVVAAAKLTAHAEAARMVARAGVDADPIEHLLESLYRAAALVEVWGAMVAIIDQAAEDDAAERDMIRGELGYSENTDEKDRDELRVIAHDRLMALNHRGEAMVHPYVREYQVALERRARFAKLCIDAGVAERQVRIMETQAEMVQKAFEAALDKLKLKPDERKEAQQTYARHLRLVG